MNQFKSSLSNDEECASTTTMQAQEKVLRWTVEWLCGILEESKKDGMFCPKS
jgi:hypothetical protein